MSRASAIIGNMIAFLRKSDEVTTNGAAMDAAIKTATVMDATTNSIESLAALANAPACATAAVEDVAAAKYAAKSAATYVITTFIPAAMDVAIAVPWMSDEVRRSPADTDVLGMSNLPPSEAVMMTYLSANLRWHLAIKRLLEINLTDNSGLRYNSAIICGR